jgi:hypothetical protein
MSVPISTRDIDYAWYVMCAALVASPLFFPRKGRRYGAVPVTIGAMGLLSRVLSEVCAQVDEAVGFRPTHEMSEAVAEPS